MASTSWSTPFFHPYLLPYKGNSFFPYLCLLSLFFPFSPHVFPFFLSSSLFSSHSFSSPFHPMCFPFAFLLPYFLHIPSLLLWLFMTPLLPKESHQLSFYFIFSLPFFSLFLHLNHYNSLLLATLITISHHYSANQPPPYHRHFPFFFPSLPLQHLRTSTTCCRNTSMSPPLATVIFLSSPFSFRSSEILTLV